MKKMPRKIYTDEQAEAVRQELLPYKAKYVAAFRSRTRLNLEDGRRFLELSHLLTGYYVHKKVWSNFSDFEEAMMEASLYGLHHHRMSVAIRIVKIKDQRRDPSGNRLVFHKSYEKAVPFGGRKK